MLLMGSNTRNPRVIPIFNSVRFYKGVSVKADADFEMFEMGVGTSRDCIYRPGKWVAALKWQKMTFLIRAYFSRILFYNDSS